MLIQQARFTDARQLTEILANGPSHNGDVLMAHLAGVVLDAERTAGLLAAWAEIVAAATGDTAALFTNVPDPEAAWVKLGRALADAARQGDSSKAEDAADRCAIELGSVDRAHLLGHWGRELIPGFIRAAGRLDELLEQAALHRSFAGGDDAGWVSAAAWTVCALTESGHVEAYNRIGDLIVKEGRGADLWQTWPQVAASMMSTGYLREIEPLPQDIPGYPVGLPLRAVEAVHSTSPKLIKRAQSEFAAQSPDNQVMLAFELAVLIGTCRALPSRRAARRAARGEHDADQQAFSDTARAIIDEMPAAVVERTGRMHAFSRRVVLAFIDADRETLAAVVDRIATWDDDPGREPYPRPRFEFPANQALALTNDLFRLGEQKGARFSDAETAHGAAELIKRDAPAVHREAALALLSAMKGDSRDGVEFDPVAATTEAGLLAFAATAAWLGTNPRLIRSRETVRLNLIKEIRESEARALKVPDRETITEIGDEEALIFLHQLYGEDYPLPRDPAERGVWEQDIVSVIKQHLLETPADATTLEQKKALHERVTAILRAAAGTPRRTPAPPDRSGVVRNQPKRKKPKNRR
ncbi:hypothetical protein ABH940_003250 [Streptacidiphilus sp. BW17]|uniref:hypothetical protein n=1 Tax=unclassified Streptacidiphilus TaxID=2643834 RepID=UPI0035115D71